MLGSGVLGVGAEVTQTHELEGGGSLGTCQAGFYLTAGEDFQRIGVQVLHQSFHAGGVGVNSVEQVVVQTDLCVHSGLGIHPVDGSALDLAAVGGIAAPGLGIVGSKNLHHIAVFVGDAAGALDQVGTLQTALGAVGVQALVLGNGLSQEIIGLDPQVPGEGDLTGAVLGTVGVVLDGNGLTLTLGDS